MPFKLCLATSQRARLITAQSVDTAKVLDGFQVFDDHLLLCHTQSTPPQRHCCDHRQELGRQTDGERDSEEQGLERLMMTKDAYQDNKEHQKENGLRDQLAKAFDSTLELGLRRPAG